MFCKSKETFIITSTDLHFPLSILKAAEQVTSVCTPSLGRGSVPEHH